MAVTWRGSVVTPQILGMPPDNGSVVSLAIVNTFRSRAKVDILRIVCQLDVTQPTATVQTDRIMPMMRSRRCSAADVSGGILVAARPPWDTALNAPDPGVEIRVNPGAYGGPDTDVIAVTPGAPVWQQFTNRHASLIRQFRSEDNSMLPALAATKDYLLQPGEALIIEQVAALPTGGTSWFQIAWEEDQVDAGYVVGGTVELSGSPVTGAKVLLVTDSTTAMTAPSIETLTTDSNGEFSKTLASDVKAAVFVQHSSGGTLYTDEGKPFIEKP
jgi:hypothetical protein